MRWLAWVMVAACSGGGASSTTTPDDSGPPGSVGGDSASVGDSGEQAVAMQETFEVQRELDVLFVVDNSGSMGDSQGVLAEGFSQAIIALLASGTDYHVGVITTDMDGLDHKGKLAEAEGHRWVQPDTPDPEDVFRQLALRGDGGSGDERGREAIYRALSGEEPANDGFRRPSAWLQVVVVSDEDDHSYGDPGSITSAEFVDWFDGLTLPERSAAHAVVNLGKGSPLIGERGTVYIELAQATGGALADISTVDEADYLSLQEVLVPPPVTVFPLAEVPVEGTLSVELSVDGAAPFLLSAGPTADYVYDSSLQAVVLNDREPNHGDVITVTYDAQP